MTAQRVTFDGVTVDLVDVTIIESPAVGPMLAGYEPATGHYHRIALHLIDPHTVDTL